MTYQGQVSVATSQYDASRMAVDQTSSRRRSVARQAATSSKAPKAAQLAERSPALTRSAVALATGSCSCSTRSRSMPAEVGRSALTMNFSA